MGHKMVERKATDKGELQFLESANAMALQSVLSWIVSTKATHSSCCNA